MPFASLPSDRLPGPLAGAVNRLLRIDKLEQLYDHARTRSRLFTGFLQELEIEVRVAPEDLRKIPATGAAVAVSNHPFGLLDGAILAEIVTRVRSDIRILTNHLLGDLPELRDICIFIDPFGQVESRKPNSRALRQALVHLARGGLLVIFPAGEVSHFDFRTAAIRDPEWHETAARLIRMTGAKTIPMHVRGANSIPFQMLGMVHPRLRTAALPAEFLNKRGKLVEVRVGGVIEPGTLQAFPDDLSAIKYLRLRTDLLARRDIPIHARGATQVPVASAEPANLIAEEIASLPASSLLEENREMAVFLADSTAIPRTLREIGRLREMTFRAAGEGTGLPRDLDRFDEHYQHLFLWNREKSEIAGAYRIGDVPRLLERFGQEGLYTDSLFRFKGNFLKGLGAALELGRSFIRPEYQRQFAPLLMLWKAICGYVSRHPEYCTLIGAVSVSNQYSRASRVLISQYFASHAPRFTAGSVKPRHPLRVNLLQKWETRALCSLLPDVDDLSGPIADLEHDGKGLPILVKQYSRFGGKLLAFSVDPQFGNTLDGFVLVDLRQSQPDLLARYMGKDRARAFYAWHASTIPRVA